MRTLTLVGRLTLGTRIVAHACAWCGRFYRLTDRVLAALGVACSHGMCPECARAWLADAEARGPAA